jgi:hypothetical protein
MFRWLLFCAFTAAASAAGAADVVYPIGSRIGLVPPPGLNPSQHFLGFEDAPHKVAITMVTLPPAAYPQLEESSSQEMQGITIERRESLSLASGKAFLVIIHQDVENMKLRKWILTAETPDLTALVTFQVPEDARDAYPDEVIRPSLTSLAVRPMIPVEEQLSLVPFRLGELAGFHVGGVVVGRAVMLIDAEAAEPQGKAQLIVAAAQGGPTQARDRDLFAHDMFVSIPNLKDVRVTSSESLRIGGQQGHQIMARAKEATTGTDVTLVQWIRFGAGGYMHLVGVARSPDWADAYPRFRAVRDGIEVP